MSTLRGKEDKIETLGFLFFVDRIRNVLLLRDGLEKYK